MEIFYDIFAKQTLLFFFLIGSIQYSHLWWLPDSDHISWRTARNSPSRSRHARSSRRRAEYAAVSGKYRNGSIPYARLYQEPSRPKLHVELGNIHASTSLSLKTTAWTHIIIVFALELQYNTGNYLACAVWTRNIPRDRNMQTSSASKRGEFVMQLARKT